MGALKVKCAYRQCEAGHDQQRILLEVIHTQLHQVVTAQRQVMGLWPQTWHWPKLEDRRVFYSDVYDSQWGFGQRYGLGGVVLVEAVDEVEHGLGVELVEGVAVHLAGAEAGRSQS